MCQNMFLATEAMGLGGYMHFGFLSREVLEALGFITVVPHGVTMLANPVGLSGVFQAYCPPFFPSMEVAVDAVLAPMSRKNAVSRSTGPVPYLISDAERHDGTVKISDEGIACTKAICSYSMRLMADFLGPWTQCISCGSCRFIIWTLTTMISFFDQVRTAMHMRTTYRPGVANGANLDEPMSAQLIARPAQTYDCQRWLAL